MSDTTRTDRAAAEVRLDLEALIRDWERAFVNRARPYAVQQDDGSYRWAFRECDARALRAHLSGTETLALSSTDGRVRCRWACLDADAPDGLAQLRHIRVALAELGLLGLMEESRRGGHLWLFFAVALPAALPRAVVGAALDGLVARGELARLPEVYPDTDGDDPARLGHAVRLPLGVHRRTGRRYPLLDGAGEPLPLTTPRDLAVQMAHLLAHPRVSATQLRAAAARLGVPPNAQGERQPGRRADRRAPARAAGSPSGGAVTAAATSTTSAMIRWVDARVSPLDLLDELCPQAKMRPVGQGYLGWCPFHDDRAPDECGEPGTPSFYVVHNRRHGWSWRCLSSNCAFWEGPMKHSFRLLQELLRLDVRAAIGAALTRWGA